MKTQKICTLFSRSCSAAFGILFVFFTNASCQKEPVPSRAEITAVSTQSVIDRFDNRIESHLKVDTDGALKTMATLKSLSKGFYTDKNPTPLSFGLDPMTIEESIYYVEALLNYDHFREYHSQVEFETHRTSKLLPLNSNGKVEEDDLVAAYDYFSEEIDENIPSGKQVLVSNVWVSDLSEEDAVFQLEVTYSETSGTVIQPLGSNDNWFAYDQTGKCDYSQAGKDAADRLETLVNWYTPTGWNGSSSSSNGGWVTTCGANTNGFWTNVSGTGALGSANNPNPWYGCSNECLGETQLESYLQWFFYTFWSGWTVGDDIFIYATWDSNALGNVGGNCSNAGRHVAVSWQGVLNCGSLPW